MNPIDRIVNQVNELDEESVKTELAFILQKYSEIGVAGYSKESLIKDIKSLYLKISMNKY